ncbi:YceI family protein, partial [Amnimonas aquatica]
GHPFYDNAPAAGFNATTTLKRSDFGLGKYVPVVGDELTVEITVEAIEASAWQKALDKKAAETKAEN